jgi:putative transposase
VDEAVGAGARREAACETLELNARTLERWRKNVAKQDGRKGPRTSPKNKLSIEERARVIEVATRKEYCDLSPNQLVPMLADKGEYIASESTFYRILRKEKLLVHRGRAAKPSKRTRPHHVATAPGQVWSWDISYLRTRVRGQFYFLYLMLDIWSRKIVGFRVELVECTDLAANLLETALKDDNRKGHPLVLHADNGGPMKGATLKATMEKLGVLASYSRPSVSNDNAFSEALFRTTKYVAKYPTDGFTTLEHARAWVTDFVAWYNYSHLHSGIAYVAPAQRHAGRSTAIARNRIGVYERAKQTHPERWTGNTRNWQAPSIVRLTPERKETELTGKLPAAA